VCGNRENLLLAALCSCVKQALFAVRGMRLGHVDVQGVLRSAHAQGAALAFALPGRRMHTVKAWTDVSAKYGTG